MENTPTPNSDFENYLRKHLQQVDATPDDDLWAQIAAKQAQPNRWLNIRRYGLYFAGAVLFMAAVIGLWRYQYGHAPANNAAKTLEQQMPQPEGATMPMAGGAEMPATNTPAALKVETVQQNSKRTAFVPNFSPRVNAVPASTIRFNAASGLRYTSPATGTTVSIPANSLVDQNGQPVSGEADLFFREYRTIEEFLASGIPMHYSDGRGDYAFNSGGMFEVRVSQAGTALSMAPGKNYDVNFSATEELEDASLYYLDDQTGEWRFQPDAAFGQANLKQPPVVTESTAMANNLSDKSSDCRPDPGIIAKEPEPEELVKLGVKTGFELATGKLVMPTWFRKNPYLTDDQLLFRLERGLVQIKKHRDQSQLFFPEDLNNFFTELSAFKDCYFAYNADLLSGEKKAKGLTNGDYWQRIMVNQENGANCIITLFDGKEGQLQFHAVLTGSTENKNFDPEKVMREYDRLRLQRQQDFAEKNKALRFFLYAASAFKPKEEYCYSAFEWLEYFEKNHPMMARRYAALIKDGLTTNDALAKEAWSKWQKILRDFRFEQVESNKQVVQSKNNLQYALHLSNFGVYNCDQIFRLGGDGAQFVVAGYKTQDGKKIIPAFVSIMERSSRLFFTLPSAEKLLWNPTRKIDVVVTDKNGRQYHFSREKYAEHKFNKDGYNVLTLNDVTEQTQSPRAWADLLEM